MKVSIVIPCYNGARDLPDAIESCMQQTYRDLEIFIVDDGSRDNSHEIASSYARKDSRVRALKHEVNAGVSQAWNTGFRASSGELMARLCHDDYYTADAIEEMVAALRLRPDAGLAYTDARIVTEQGSFVREKRLEGPETALLSKNGFGQCVMWRRAVWEKMGGFLSEYDSAEDYEFMQRAMEWFPAVHVEKLLLNERDHEGRCSHVHSAKQRWVVQRVQSRVIKGGVARRKFLCAGCFDAAYNYREQKKWAQAFSFLIKALGYWPFDAKIYKGLAALLFHRARAR